MTFLTKDQILGAQDLEHEDHDIKEWGGKVRIRSMTAAERDSFEAQIFKEGKDGNRTLNMDNLRARLLALTIVDEKNKRLFQDNDIAALGGKNAAVLDRLFEASQRLSGIRKVDIEEAIKNSESAR